MVRVIVAVLLLLLILGYAAMFLSWNLKPVTVTGFAWGTQGYVEDVPLGVLILGGLLAGAILMGAFAAGAYQALRCRCAMAESKVGLAKRKLDELVAKVKQQRDKIADLEKKMAAPAEPAPEPAPAAAPSPPSVCPVAIGEDEEEI
jgi:uncharacterized integral membrane protein